MSPREIDRLVAEKEREAVKTWRCQSPHDVIVVSDEGVANALQESTNAGKCGHPHAIVIGEVGVSKTLEEKEQEIESLKIELDGAIGRGQTVLKFKNQWADKSRKQDSLLRHVIGELETIASGDKFVSRGKDTDYQVALGRIVTSLLRLLALPALAQYRKEKT